MSEQVVAPETGLDDAKPFGEVPVGLQLQRAREARGMGIAEIAQTLKLGQKQVASLENGDWASLPGHTFIRGFVRNYARLVQLDFAPLMIQLDHTLAPPVSNLHVPETKPAEIQRSVFSGSGKDRQMIFGGAAVLLLALGAYFLMPNDLSDLRVNIQQLLDSLGRKEAVVDAAASSQANDPVLPPGASMQQVLNPQALAPAEPAANSASEPAATTAPSSQIVPLAQQTASTAAGTAPQIRFVADKESWIEIRDRDNKVVFSQKVAAGTEQAVSGQGPLSVVIGYAPAVRLFWHGQAVDLAPHAKGDVARLVLE